MVGSEENYNFDVGVKGLREELIPFAPTFFQFTPSLIVICEIVWLPVYKQILNLLIYLLLSYFYGSNSRQLKKAMAHDSPL